MGVSDGSENDYFGFLQMPQHTLIWWGEYHQRNGFYLFFHAKLSIATDKKARFNHRPRLNGIASRCLPTRRRHSRNVFFLMLMALV